MLPKITVVTPSLNQGGFIRETIESVLSQEYPDLEYWIVDGGSTDGTLEALHSYGSRIRWVSENDSGQAEAVNKGFARATGEILGWLNSDDTYLPGALQAVGEFFAAHPAAASVYGDAYCVDRDGRNARPYPTRDFEIESFAGQCYVCQPTVFFRRVLLQQMAPLDTRLHLCLDYELWMRLFRLRPPVRLKRFLATSRMYAENKTLRERTSMLREVIATVRRHYGYVPYSWALARGSHFWHRNDQYFDPRPTTLPVFALTVALLCWYNRSSPRYLWRWFRDGEGGFIAEASKGLRGRTGSTTH